MKLRGLVQKYKTSYQVARSSLFWALLSRQKRHLRWMFAFFVVSSVALFQIANFTRGMVDNAIVDQLTPIGPWVGKILVWALVSLAASIGAMLLLTRVGYQLEFDLRTWMYTHIQSADLRRLDSVSGGQLVTRSLTDLALVEQLLQIFPAIIGFLPILLGLGVLVIILSPPLGVLALVAAPINIWLLNRFRVRLRALSWADLNERAEVTRAIDEPVRGIRVVKAFGREHTEGQKVKAVTERAFRFSMSRARLIARYDVALKLAPFVVQAAVLYIGARLIASDHLTLGTFLLAFQICTVLAGIAGQFDEIASAWQYLRGAQDRITEMLALAGRPFTDGRMAPPPSTGLEMREVRVDLGTRRVLEAFGIDVAPGELVVVSGAPGSGKSTIAAVASGVLVQGSGTVALDGMPIAELDPAELRRAIRVVAEEPVLFATTLRENLTMGAPDDVTDDDLLRALQAAGALEVVGELTGGLDGYVGDRGLTLSGGQRQRVALARALAARPRVLVLDDALSAVNPSLEQEIVGRIRAELPDTAVLFLARRRGPEAQADRVVELPPPSSMQVVRDSSAEELAALTSAMSPLMVGNDAIDAVMAVEEVGEATEAAEGVGTFGAGGDGSAFDPALARAVGALQLTTETIPVPDGDVDGDRPPRFWRIARRFKWIGLVALGAVLVFGVAQLTPNILFGQVTEVVNTDSKDTAGAVLLALAVLVVGAAGAASSYAFRVSASRFTQCIVALLRRRIFFRLSRLGVDYYDRELPGQVAARVAFDLDRILQFMERTGLLLLTHVTIFVVGMTMIVVIAPQVFPLALVVAAVVATVGLIELPIGNRAFRWARKELGIVTAKFEEDFVARHEIRNLGAGELQTKKFVDACWQRRRAKWWAQTVQVLGTQVLTFVGIMGRTIVLWRCGTLTLDGSLGIGTALSVYLIIQTATAPLSLIGPLYNQLLEVRVSWARLRDPFGEPVLPQESADAAPCPDLRGEVALEHVTFAYPQTAREVLHDVSLRIPAGTVTALVGYTGAGKSSVAKLLSRTYDPTAGRVTVDGIDLRDMVLPSYIPHLGVVPQDAFVFRGTVASNIAYANPDAAREAVERAARDVGAFDVLSALPGGFDAAVEEEGKNLTPAQRQLIALARAWMTRPDVLVLDEATSLLDADVEQRVLDAVHALGCTTLMITHRETVARRADEIVVLDGGRVVDAGPMEHVSRPGSPYERLWRVDESPDAVGVSGIAEAVDTGA